MIIRFYFEAIIRAGIKGADLGRHVDVAALQLVSPTFADISSLNS